MKQKIIRFTPEELTCTLQNKLTQYNLPLDIELIDIKYDAYTKQVTAVIRSDLFEENIKDTPTPELTYTTPKKTPPPPTLQQPILQPEEPTIKPLQPLQPPTPQNTTTTTTTAVTSTINNISSGIKTLNSKPETNTDTCGYEEEFTKEQRKILKFSATPDHVIIKPAHFLKDEWEDINDTVKSIGGRWVKGAIDHWAIPKNIAPLQE